MHEHTKLISQSCGLQLISPNRTEFATVTNLMRRKQEKDILPFGLFLVAGVRVHLHPPLPIWLWRIALMSETQFTNSEKKFFEVARLFTSPFCVWKTGERIACFYRLEFSLTVFYTYCSMLHFASCLLLPNKHFLGMHLPHVFLSKAFEIHKNQQISTL